MVFENVDGESNEMGNILPLDFLFHLRVNSWYSLFFGNYIISLGIVNYPQYRKVTFFKLNMIWKKAKLPVNKVPDTADINNFFYASCFSLN